MNRAQLPNARVVGAPSVNPFEQAARYRKVQALVITIDGIAIEKGVDPLRDPAEVVRRLKLMPPSWWVAVSKRAHVNPPSDLTAHGLTIKAVIGSYIARIGEGRRAAS